MSQFRRLRWRLRLEWLAILVIAMSVAYVSNRAAVLNRLDFALLDKALPYAAAPPSDEIIVVEIDERSLRQIGQWPWPRDQQARLIDAITAARSRVTVYDVLLVEPGDPAGDAKLAAAIRRAANVVLPLTFEAPGADGRAIDVFRPVGGIGAAAAATGHVALYPDRDGVVRRVELPGAEGAPPFKHLSQVALSFAGERQRAVADRTGGSVLIPFNPRGSFRSVPAAAVMNGEVPANFIKDKLVFVGATAQALDDRYPVSASSGSMMPGIEILANLTNGMMAERLVRDGPWWSPTALAWLLAVFVMIGFWRARPGFSLWIALAGFLVPLAFSLALLIGASVWVPPSGAALAVSITYPLWSWRRLNALDDFVEGETARLHNPALANRAEQTGGLDLITQKAERLRGLIADLSGRETFITGVIDSSPDAICVVDTSNRVIYANTRFRSLFGAEITGRDLDSLISGASLRPDEAEGHWRSRDGAFYLTNRNFLGTGDVIGEAQIVRFADVTSIREAERERLELLEFLSHDMRAPQAAIISLIESKEDLSIGADELARVKRYANRTLKMAEDFVQLSRLRNVGLDLAETDLHGLMLEAVDQVHPLATRKSITLRLNDLDEEAFALVDGATLLRAFANLLGNAIKYSPPDSTIECSVELRPLKPGEGNDVIVSVRDHGPGLPPDRTEDPFRRFGQIASGPGAGAGLGLAYVKEAVERNGGSISWASSSDGTSFTMTFPALD